MSPLSPTLGIAGGMQLTEGFDFGTVKLWRSSVRLEDLYV